MHVPASSVAIVYAKGLNRRWDGNSNMLLEPTNTLLPGGLMIFPSVIQPNSHVSPIQVINLSQEDVWVPPKTRLGILTQCPCVEGEPYEVKFQRISANHEEVTIDWNDGQGSDRDIQSLLDRIHLGGTTEQ